MKEGSKLDNKPHRALSSLRTPQQPARTEQEDGERGRYVEVVSRKYVDVPIVTY
jgi:hypothetical protein